MLVRQHSESTYCRAKSAIHQHMPKNHSSYYHRLTPHHPSLLVPGDRAVCEAVNVTFLYRRDNDMCPS